MNARSIEEWVGKNGDTQIPPRVRLRVFERYGGKCTACTRSVHGGKWQCDHIHALINGGANSESNLQVLCSTCHRRKSGADVAQKARSYSSRLKQAGIKAKKKRMGYRKFDGTVVPPRYE